MTENFWKSRRVLLTGHTGFKGSWLSLWLQRLGADLTGYALPPPTSPSLFDVARVADGMRSVVGDVRDPASLKQVFVEARPEIVIHFAAQSVVRTAYDDPVDTYATNVMGTVHLLEAVRQTPSVRIVLNVTTDKVYENKEWDWGYRETDALGGSDPYSNSKACSELVTSAYRSSFFSSQDPERENVKIATARAGNVVGGGDWTKDQLIPDIFRALLTNETLVIRNPRSIRPWQFVLEALDGYLTLIERLWADGSLNGAWNIGPATYDAIPVETLVRTFLQKWGTPARIQLAEAGGPHETRMLRLDPSKALARLGWRPRLDLDQALALVTDWYRAFASGSDMHAMTIEQIRAFESQRQLEVPQHIQ